MADPHIKETLDMIDRISIITYRSGMLVTGLTLFILALQQILYPSWFKEALTLVAFGALLQASSLHIYSKAVRWLLVNATWMGCWLLSFSFATGEVWFSYLSLGAIIITLSGLAYKESFCFSLMILKIIPFLLVVAWVLTILSLNQWAALSLMLSAILYLYMAWRKINMPLYFDLGDRSRYQV